MMLILPAIIAATPMVVEQPVSLKLDSVLARNAQIAAGISYPISPAEDALLQIRTVQQIHTQAQAPAPE